MILATLFRLLFGAIVLDGVTGDQLSASAFFDANNVSVGDPLVLTVDFVGTADFTALHPPALAREVDASVWKVDDVSARTDTWEGYGRRLVYRVRAMKPGLHRFPSLSFAYAGGRGGGETVTVSTPAIPVHVRPGVQVALAGVYDDGEDLPMPDGIVVSAPAGLGDDRLFDWRKACGNPTADAFAAFDFPEARLNEAACALVEGNWARALKVYSSLEWRIGQTPAVERGIVAALARKTGDAAAELPVWRQVMRPLLRFAWLGRVLVSLGLVAGVALVFFLCGRVIRAFAGLALAVALLPAAAAAMDPFELMDRQMQEMFQRMGRLESSLSLNGVEQKPLEIAASLRTDRTDICQGETFHYILALEAPKTCSFDQVNVRPSNEFGLVYMSKSFENLPNGASANPSNVVRRMQIAVRYDVPFRGPVSFAVSGMASSRVTANRGRSTYSFSQSFRVETEPVEVEVKPLPTDRQPKDFSGAIGESFALTRSVNANRVETNDVVTVVNTLAYSGFVPAEVAPDLIERRPGRLRWREYFVADGSAAEIPPRTLVYYDTAARAYRTVSSKPVALEYVASASDGAAGTVAVDARGDEREKGVVRLRFYPRDAAPVIAVSAGPRTVTEERGAWARIDDGRHAGWVRKEELR